MNQLAFTLTAPMARRSDPASSHVSALEHGERAHHAALILEAVIAETGLTYREIHARLAGRIREAVEVQRRLNDLAHEGLIERTTTRRCSISDRLAQTWRATLP